MRRSKTAAAAAAAAAAAPVAIIRLIHTQHPNVGITVSAPQTHIRGVVQDGQASQSKHHEPTDLTGVWGALCPNTVRGGFGRIGGPWRVEEVEGGRALNTIAKKLSFTAHIYVRYARASFLCASSGICAQRCHTNIKTPVKTASANRRRKRANVHHSSASRAHHGRLERERSARLLGHAASRAAPPTGITVRCSRTATFRPCISWLSMLTKAASVITTHVSDRGW